MTADFDEAGRMAHARIAVRIVEQRPAVVKCELSLDDDMIAGVQRRRLPDGNVVRHIERHVGIFGANVDDEPLVETASTVAVGENAQDRSFHNFFGSRAVRSYVRQDASIVWGG